MISDQHSIEYEFERLRVPIGNIGIDIYISGSAELANDPVGGWCGVRRIILPGDTPDMMARPSLFLGRPRKSVDLILDRPKDTDHSPQANLFRLIAAAIDDDERAKDAWLAEIEEAA